VRITKSHHRIYWFFLAQTLIFGVLLSIGKEPAVWANDQVHTQILSAQEALYNGNFEDALQLFTSLTQAYPNDPKGYFFVALTYRWLTRIDPESSYYQKQFEQASETAIRIAKSLLDKDDTHVEAILYLAATYGYRAEYYNFLKNRWDKAYDDGIKMREYLGKAEKFSLSDNIDVQLGYGLYNYYAYVYRKKIGWWRFLLSLPKGDKEKGIELLQTVRKKGVYLKVEAWYFLIDIYKKEEGDSMAKAISLCEQLHRTYPSHPYFHIFLAGLYHKHLDWKNSIRTATEILEQSKTNPYYSSDFIVYQAKYLIGESSFYIGKYQEALRQFDEIIGVNPSHPSYLVPWSHLRRGTIYDLTGKKDEAAVEYQLVLKMENVLHVHNLAEGLLKNQKNRQSAGGSKQ
jgi:tetratricopeptide (TPR) repeat protein